MKKKSKKKLKIKIILKRVNSDTIVIGCDIKIKNILKFLKVKFLNDRPINLCIILDFNDFFFQNNLNMPQIIFFTETDDVSKPTIFKRDSQYSTSRQINQTKHRLIITDMKFKIKK